MRLSEVAPLRLTDVELPDRRQPAAAGPATGHVRIWRGRLSRLVTLNTKACAALRGYLLVRPSDAEDDRLFQGKFRRGIGPRSVESIVGKYLRDAGIRGASVHTLRHTFPVHTLTHGMDPEHLQRVLGQASRKTVSSYVELAWKAMEQQLQEHAL